MVSNLFKSEKIGKRNVKWEQCVSREENLYRREKDLRSEFYRDYGRILHSQPYRRLKHKTQVFFATQNDHICTRMEHVQHVVSVSYTIAQYLGLNIELTQAIALGHDIGHAPFGHEGEERLKEIAKSDLNEDFWHEKNGIIVSDKIATLPDDKGIQKNLHLTYAVRDGIISHCGEIDENGLFPRDEVLDLHTISRPNQYRPFTWEGCVVKIADKIAYLGRDIEDALELRLLSFSQLLKFRKIISQYANLTVLNNTVLMHNLIIDLCENSTPNKGLCLSEKYYQLIKDVKKFNYENIYSDKRIVFYKRYSKLIICTIYAFLKNYYNNGLVEQIKRDIPKFPFLMKNFYEWLIKYSDIDIKRKKQMRFGNIQIYNVSNERDYYRAIIDFIAGMTDNFAIKSYHEIISF